jgi:hypothetical protein
VIRLSIFRLSSLNDLRITEGEEFLRKSADEIYRDILCKDVELKKFDWGQDSKNLVFVYVARILSGTYTAGDSSGMQRGTVEECKTLVYESEDIYMQEENYNNHVSGVVLGYVYNDSSVIYRMVRIDDLLKDMTSYFCRIKKLTQEALDNTISYDFNDTISMHGELGGLFTSMLPIGITRDDYFCITAWNEVAFSLDTLRLEVFTDKALAEFIKVRSESIRQFTALKLLNKSRDINYMVIEPVLRNEEIYIRLQAIDYADERFNSYNEDAYIFDISMFRFVTELGTPFSESINIAAWLDTTHSYKPKDSAVILPSNLRRIESHALSGIRFTNPITLPDSIEFVNELAFASSEGIVRMSKEVKQRLDESGANYKSGEHLVRFLVG